MTNIIRRSTPLTALAASVLAISTFTIQPTKAATSFDGQWSVRITAENGSCTDRYTVPLQVSGGHVSYTGSFNAKANGKISSNGRLNVTFAHQNDVVSARGSLVGASGFGSWRSPTKKCDGTWTARKG